MQKSLVTETRLARWKKCNIIKKGYFGGVHSVGRVLDSHSRGQGFDPPRLHHSIQNTYEATNFVAFLLCVILKGFG